MENVTVKYELVEVDQLVLDLNNPRIAQWMEMYGANVNDEAMKLALQRGGSDDKAAGHTRMCAA